MKAWPISGAYNIKND